MTTDFRYMSTRVATVVVTALAFTLASCSSVRYPQPDSYYGYFNPREQPSETESTTTIQSDQSSVEDYASTTESTVTSGPTSTQLSPQYSTSYADGTPVVINNYFSSGYTPVITPWWNSYYSSWSYGQPGFSVGYGYSPWTSWRFNYDPWFGSTYSWGYNWYAPWYGCNPYYGFGYRPYYTFYDGYYGRPWYYSSSSWGGYYDHYTAHRDERRWGSTRGASGSPGTSTSVGGYANPGGRDRAVPLGSTRSTQTPQIENTRFGRVRSDVAPNTIDGTTSTRNNTTSPFSDPGVTRTEEGSSRPSNQSHIDTQSSHSPSRVDRVRSFDGSGVVRSEGDRSLFGGSRSATRPSVSVPSTSNSRPSVPNVAPSSSGSTKSSGSSSGNSSGGGRKR